MSDYVENNLGMGEKVVLRAKISWLTLLKPIISCVLIEIIFHVILSIVLKSFDDPKTKTIIIVVLEILIQVIAWLPLIKQIIINNTTKLAVTNKRIIGKIGVFSIHTIDYHIEKVDNISYNAGAWGNFLKYYRVTISGTGGDSITVPAVSNAQEFKNKVNEAIENHAAEARRSQASEIAAAISDTRR